MAIAEELNKASDAGCVVAQLDEPSRSKVRTYIMNVVIIMIQGANLRNERVIIMIQGAV